MNTMHVICNGVFTVKSTSYKLHMQVQRISLVQKSFVKLGHAHGPTIRQFIQVTELQ